MTPILDQPGPWSMPGAAGEPILGHTHLPTATPRGALVLCHGFKGYMDYGFFPRLADAATDAGLAVVRFNFSHSGMTRNTETFERPNLFEHDTWQKQVHDLSAVIRSMHHTSDLSPVVFGHSRGGLTALLTADRLLEPPAGVIAAAAPADAHRLDPDQRATLKRLGRLPSPSGRTGQELYIGKAWLEEIERDPVAHDPLRAIANLSIPVLLLHGDADGTVSPDDMRRYAEAAPGHAEAVLIQGGNHVFNAPNPMPRDADPAPQTAELFERVTAFALRCCDP